MFSIMNLGMLGLYLVVLLPAGIAYTCVASYFDKKERSLVHTFKTILVAIGLGGIACVFLTIPLNIRGLIFSHSSSYVQIMVIILTLIVSLPVFGRIILSKKVLNYLKKLEQ